MSTDSRREISDCASSVEVSSSAEDVEVVCVCDRGSGSVAAASSTPRHLRITDSSSSDENGGDSSDVARSRGTSRQVNACAIYKRIALSLSLPFFFFFSFFLSSPRKTNHQHICAQPIPSCLPIPILFFHT